jgi:serine phosphatase RsbU (regulator of sigma subunit)
VAVTSVQAKIKKALFLGGASLLLLLVFVIDIVRRSLDSDLGWLQIVREVFVAVAFLLFYFVLESMWRREQSPAKKLGFALVLSLVVGVMTLLLSFVDSSGFDVKSSTLIPLGFDAILWANVFGIVLGATMLIILLLLRDIIFSKRRKGTRRNFMTLLVLILATASLSLSDGPVEASVTTSIVFGIAVLAMIVNSFRLSWIVYLSKREKIYSIVYGLLLFLIFVGFDLVSAGSSTLGRSLAFYSPALKSFIFSVSILGTIFFGMTFVSTLFHLPTAEAFDRKITEVSSLHNLSRLVTQVLDFNELVESVTTMTLEVCEAKSAWLEIARLGDGAAGKRLLPSPRHEELIDTLAVKNISLEETRAVTGGEGAVLRTLVLQQRKAVVIDEVKYDRRTKHLAERGVDFESLVIVPLMAHERTIGLLYATKSESFGFDQEDVELISAFADQATIAIENSRLIEKSLERERLMREMMLAQEMQRKLLPQRLPALKEIDLEALSTPAFEVGGDYYDFRMLDDHSLGILVGDVSGKGVSAAFYMAEMKGIFQSLSQIYRSPRAFLSRAHTVLSETIDKRSFISLIYAVIDLQTGVVDVARAGHCPLLHISGLSATYIKPTGLGLGMGSSEFFDRTITEEQIQLRAGDVIVLYTDGVTEAHPGDEDEFGYERLLETVRRSRHLTAVEIRDALIMEVDRHMNHESPEDDLTIVVLKWLKQ